MIQEFIEVFDMKSVLVIESNDAIREAVNDLLLLVWPKLSILTAATASKGLHLAQEHQPDLILLEGEMAGTINGFQAAKVLRHLPETKEIPLIAFTSPAFDNEQIIDGLQETCNAWLHKPFSADNLLNVIRPFSEIMKTNVAQPAV